MKASNSDRGRNTRTNENSNVIPPEKSVKRSQKYLEADSLMILMKISYNNDVFRYKPIL